MSVTAIDPIVEEACLRVLRSVKVPISLETLIQLEKQEEGDLNGVPKDEVQRTVSRLVNLKMVKRQFKKGQAKYRMGG